MTTTADPLTVLPPEIVLRVLEFTPVSAIGSLTAVSKAWHGFIDATHQETIYASKTTQPPGARDFSFLSETTCYSKLFEGTESWKDLCKRQTLLARSWDVDPVTREAVLQIGNDPVWRFRADFKRRFFVSTSQAGGLNVTDMDSGRILWQLPSTLDREEDAVRPFAHLEYQDGMAVFDREGDAVEVWKAVDDWKESEGRAKRGEFERIAILDHDCQTRGFQLSHWTLCVVSTEGQGFVYDMTERPPRRTTHLKIENEAVGHLDQSKDVVIYSMGARGYHAYDKKTGAFLGALEPSKCTERHHIRAPPSTRATRHGPTNKLSEPRKDSLVQIKVEKGPLPPSTDPEHVRNTEDEWGAGMINGDLFVGFSRAGRAFVCSNWRKALETSIEAHSSVIECESDGSRFDLGGWLSVRNHRLMFEIQDRIYVVALDDNNKVQDVDSDTPPRASFSLVTSSSPQLAVPVSFMALYDDAIMTTYTTLGWRPSLPAILGDIPPEQQGPARIFPTKAIRIVSLAPILSDKAGSTNDETTQETDGGMWNPNQAAEQRLGTHAGLVELISMLGDEFGGDDDDDEIQDVDFNGGLGEWVDVDSHDDYEEDDDEHENQNQQPNEHQEA
ncbi:hypothetical protein ASPWEDRAFT_164094 [Aspergillus wentii DTO 134E9]|uniref:F-box domain-containing protein n=1 Tax=Aspergillus wentii DTO 134E9 TaxID=1073089 RepID=A0A1L9R5L1_ASPWE|nr:uncharacterized protein ASPWEDRAFT_164094 [Aspergillus wentii DTO 134E9]OJJ30168.1 hypothetical protein ASPWEDRAFT_164094 [Aspergillus wentii DTO 134E9]